jgi:hypothetical protein
MRFAPLGIVMILGMLGVIPLIMFTGCGNARKHVVPGTSEAIPPFSPGQMVKHRLSYTWGIIVGRHKSNDVETVDVITMESGTRVQVQWYLSEVEEAN